jgi:hypothetical protein
VYRITFQYVIQENGCGFKIDLSTYTIDCLMALLQVYVQVIIQICQEGNQLIFNYITTNSTAASDLTDESCTRCSTNCD